MLSGRGQARKDHIKKRLDAHVLDRRSAEHGQQSAADRAVLEPGDDVLPGKVALVEVFLEQAVVGLGDLLHQLFPIGRDLVLHVGGDVLFLDLAAPVPGEHQRLHLDEVHDAGELVFEPDGKLEHDRILAEVLFHVAHGAKEVGPLLVELAHKGHAGSS